MENPEAIERLNRKYFRVRGGVLGRHPNGRKGYNGRVEHSHRTDDEEFYRSMLLELKSEEGLIERAFQSEVFYNVHRPHYGVPAGCRRPLEALMCVESPCASPCFSSRSRAPRLILQAGCDVPANYTFEVTL